MLRNNSNTILLEREKSRYRGKSVEDVRAEFEKLFRPVRTHVEETVVVINHLMTCEWCGKKAHTLIWEEKDAGQFAEMKLCKDCDEALVIRPKDLVPEDWAREMRRLKEEDGLILTEDEIVECLGKSFRDLKGALKRRFDWSGYKLFYTKNYDIMITREVEKIRTFQQ